MPDPHPGPRYRTRYRESLPPMADYEGSDYRRDYWEGHGREYEDLAERAAIGRLLPKRGRRLADIGAGYGRLAGLYAGYDRIYLVDYSRSLLEEARQWLGDGRFVYVAADIYSLPLATSAVDSAVLVRVLHHLGDVAQALQQISRALRPQGSLVLEYANKRHLKAIGRWMVGRGARPSGRAPQWIDELYYHFHPAWIDEQLRAASLLPQRRVSVSLLRAAALKRAFGARALVRLESLLQRLDAPLALGPSVFVVAAAGKAGEPDLSDGPFRCPACGCEPLPEGEAGVRCAACGRTWPRVNGVYVFKRNGWSEG